MAEQELPLVSVVTSTRRRADVLMQRCIPSVMAQSYPNVEHIIVSDGPDDELLGKLRSFLDESDAPDNLELHFLEEHSKIARHWGGFARNRGLNVARSELIAYCDDDDALRPRHVELLVAALKANPRAGFRLHPDDLPQPVRACADRRQRPVRRRHWHPHDHAPREPHSRYRPLGTAVQL
jgi:glycosyltransferase involved in cell wall biosynthesis